MFADNERISWIQMERQFALAYLGPIVLWTGRGLSGKEGIFSIFLGTGILCIWVFFYFVRCIFSGIRKNTGGKL